MNRALAVSVAAVMGTSSPTFNLHAGDEAGMTLIPSGTSIQWAPAPPSLPKGTQLVVINGDPAKPGPFVLRIKFPPGTVVAPHTHATAENLTVLTGTLYHGMGKTLQKTEGKKLIPGGFVYLPADMPHAVWTTGTESTVQVTGTGPFGLKYVNPADDPSRQP